MVEESSLSFDLNKVFVPCRTVLEMEALTSLFLATSNYDKIKEVPESQPSSQQLIDIFGVKGNTPHERIIDFFISVAVEKLKPIVMYAREHHERYRMGNVTPYTKTRNCLFFALHRLKVKFLIIKNFLEDFKKNKYELDAFYDQDTEINKTVISTLYEYYIKKNKMNLEVMLPKEGVSERVKGLIDRKDSITNEKLLEMATYTFHSEEENIVRYIMREIKASLFVCKLMFAKMDVSSPFLLTRETMIDVEEMMVSNDFIPALLPAMSKCFSEDSFIQLVDCFTAFDFMVKRVLEGVNHAIEIASGGQLKIELDDTLYNTGDIFKGKPALISISKPALESKIEETPAPKLIPKPIESTLTLESTPEFTPVPKFERTPEPIPVAKFERIPEIIPTPEPPEPISVPQFERTPEIVPTPEPPEPIIEKSMDKVPRQTISSSLTRDALMKIENPSDIWERLAYDIELAQNYEEIALSLGSAKESLKQFVRLHNVLFEMLNEATRFRREGGNNIITTQEKLELLKKVERWVTQL